MPKSDNMKTLLCIALLVTSLSGYAQPSVRSFSFPSNGMAPGGEVQSCVLAPGQVKGLNNARVLITSDYYVNNSNASNFIYYYDIVPGSTAPLAMKASSIKLSELGADYQFGTNDHDITTLPDGNIIFSVGVFSKKNVAIKPDWWNDTYRGTFGPGARTGVAFWRSTDGGVTFSYQGIYDPLSDGPAFAANPQFRKDANGKLIESAPWDMGGSDGQMTRVVTGEGGRLYLLFGVFGYDGATKNGKFVLDAGNFFNRSVLAWSDDEGKSWKANNATFPSAQWRGAVNTVSAGGVKYIGMNTWWGVLPGSLNGGSFNFSANVSQPTNLLNWNQMKPISSADSIKTINNYFYANIWCHPVMAKCPGRPYFVAGIPSLIDNKRGLRVYIYDPVKDSYNEMKAVLPYTDPKGKMPGSTIIHPVLIESPGGPMLLYWTDVDENTLKYAIKGRIIYNDKEYSDDFLIRDYDFLPGKGVWIGDYSTAGAYARVEKGFQVIGRGKAEDQLRTSFYPIWYEPAGTKFAEVTVYTSPSALYKLNKAISRVQVNSRLNIIDSTGWKKAANRPITQSMVKFNPDEYRVEKPVLIKKPINQ